MIELCGKCGNEWDELHEQRGCVASKPQAPPPSDPGPATERDDALRRIADLRAVLASTA